MRPMPHPPVRERGYLLLGLLLALAMAAALAVQTGQRWASSRQRAAEADLLSVGEQYRRAIESYWRQSPSGLRTLPVRLEDLLEDKRFPQVKRHLRRLYADPLDPQSPWGLVRGPNGIAGVYSQADGRPFLQVGFTPEQLGFEGATSYAEWKFTAKLSAPTLTPAVPGVLPRAPGARP